jgi:hypothetical protein
VPRSGRLCESSAGGWRGNDRWSGGDRRPRKLAHSADRVQEFNNWQSIDVQCLDVLRPREILGRWEFPFKPAVGQCDVCTRLSADIISRVPRENAHLQRDFAACRQKHVRIVFTLIEVRTEDRAGRRGQLRHAIEGGVAFETNEANTNPLQSILESHRSIRNGETLGEVQPLASGPVTRA